MVGEVFNRVAAKYDLMNDLMSGFMHRYWKQHLVTRISPHSDTRLLDVAGGTGDIAFRFLERVGFAFGEGNKAHVTIVDINKEMLGEGMRRLDTFQHLDSSQVDFMHASAEHLEGVSDNSYDVYTISFGIRNCTHPSRVLEEAYRVLRPGGHFLCLEFGKVEGPILDRIYDAYSFGVIPIMGKIIADDSESYQYLVESIRKFPKQEDFQDMLAKAGFLVDPFEDLTAGVATIWSGWKMQ